MRLFDDMYLYFLFNPEPALPWKCYAEDLLNKNQKLHCLTCKASIWFCCNWRAAFSDIY